VDYRVLTGSKEAWLIMSGTRPDAAPDCNRIMPHGQSASVGGARRDCERDINSPRRKRFRQRRQPRLRERLVGRIAGRVIALIIIPPQHTFHARVRARFPSFCGEGGEDIANQNALAAPLIPKKAVSTHRAAGCALRIERLKFRKNHLAR